VQQHPENGGVAPALRSTGTVDCFEYGDGFGAGEAEGGGVLGIHGRTAHRRGRVGEHDVEVVLLEEEATERRQRRELPTSRRRSGATLQEIGEI
jgi:hypothetical protein